MLLQLQARIPLVIECNDNNNTLTKNTYNDINCIGNLVSTDTISSGCHSDGITYNDFECSHHDAATEKFISYTIFAVLMAYLF